MRLSDDAGQRALVSVASRVLHQAGQGDLIWGHVSLRDDIGRGAWMKASGWGLDEVTPDRVLLIGPEGSVLEGDGPRHIEYHIHAAIYAVRADVHCVVHTHAGSVNAFAALNVPLRPISHEGSLFAPSNLARFSGTTNLISSRELGDELADDLGTRSAILLPGHGLVAVGVDVGTAVMTAVLLERACALALRVEAAGGPRQWTSDEEAAEKRQICWSPSQLKAGWEYLVRGLETA
jgi:ribulose-5-phosphate 4-epimerase/fuculose-1-phosphate aldolase